MTQPELERGHGARDTHTRFAPLNTFDGDHACADTHVGRVAVEDLERGHGPGDTHGASAPLNISSGDDHEARDTHRGAVAVGDTLERGQAVRDAQCLLAPLNSFDGDQARPDTHGEHVAVEDHIDLEWDQERLDTQDRYVPLNDGRGQFGRGAHCGGAPAVNPLERGHQLPGTQTKRAPLNPHFDGDQAIRDIHTTGVVVGDTFDELERGHRPHDTQARFAPLYNHFDGDHERSDTQRSAVAVEDRQEGVT